MKILALETATDACSVALLIDDNLFVEFELAPRQHTKLILPMVGKVLATAGIVLTDLDAIAFGRGPGAFTGLRIAAGVTQGLALAADLPVIPISTLAALAQQSYAMHQHTHIMVALDARINEVYWGCYVAQDNRLILQGKEQVLLPQSVALEVLHTESWVGVGSGWSVYADVLQGNVGEVKHIYADSVPSAASIARLAVDEFVAGKVVAVEEAQPIYLRDKVAETIAERKKKQHVQ
jgi:tRNA threonylcarbamoyladenosine biosynthesis protein TsaB